MNYIHHLPNRFVFNLGTETKPLPLVIDTVYADNKHNSITPCVAPTNHYFFSDQIALSNCYLIASLTVFHCQVFQKQNYCF